MGPRIREDNGRGELVGQSNVTGDHKGRPYGGRGGVEGGGGKEGS